MELEEVIKRLEQMKNSLIIEEYDYGWVMALEKAIKYIKEESIPKAIVKELIQQKKSRIEKLHPASDCVIIDDLENQIQVLQEILNKGELEI